MSDELHGSAGGARDDMTSASQSTGTSPPEARLPQIIEQWRAKAERWACVEAEAWNKPYADGWKEALEFCADDFAALLRGPVDLWQPIETAPKDGMEILVFDQGAIFVTSWLDDPADGKAGWWDNGIVDPPPTHWMPLPPPPVAALLREGRAPQTQEQEKTEMRVDDSQYGAPLATAAENKPVPTKDAAWAVRNCHMLARRELKRLASWRKNGGETTPVGMVETAWEHIQRICELTGYVGDGPLRESSSVSPHQARYEP